MKRMCVLFSLMFSCCVSDVAREAIENSKATGGRDKMPINAEIVDYEKLVMDDDYVVCAERTKCSRTPLISRGTF